MADKIYLDQHAATRPHPAAAQELLSFYHEHWGAFSSPHVMGQELTAPLAWALAEIRAQLGAHAKDPLHFFPSDAAARLEIFLSHYLNEVRHTGKNHILAAGIAPLDALGCIEKPLPYNAEGQITKEALASSLNPRVSLVSIPWACGHTGVIQPISDLAEICAEKGVRLHVDASAVIGKLFFRLEDLPIDYLTIEGSRIHAPQGTALLAVKQKIPFSPLAVPSYQIGVGGITAFARALSETASWFDHLSLETARLRAHFEKGILEAIPSARILGKEVERLPHCSAIHFPGVHPEALLYLLQRKGVYAASIGDAVSFTLSFETTEEEMSRALSLLILSAKQLIRCSQEVVCDLAQV
ncbi:MAG: aminotransferase class V-fold PLP-dependent enzyme [Verrucomicrobia bacterium]|nr:aminotransferase class V-fold PLP-dependent enzyme [Verrucomicrobiota bacterium]